MRSEIISFLLFGLSFVWLPIEEIEIIRVLLAELIIGYVIWQNRENLFIFRSDKKFLIGFLGLLLMQLPWIVGTKAMFGNIFRFQGWWLYLLLVLLALTMSGKLKMYKYWLPTLYLAGLAVSAGILLGNESGRAIGVIGEPNMLAAAAIFAWPYQLKYFKGWWNLLAIIPLVIILWLTVSRSALIALGLQLLLLVGVKMKINLKKMVWLSVFGLIMAMFLPTLKVNRIWENRYEIWQTAVIAGGQKPIFGWGFGNVEVGLQRAAEIRKNNLRYMYVDSAHNIWLDWWISGGVVGILIFVGICFVTLKNMVNELAWVETMVFVGVLTCLSFNPASIISLVQMWWLIGSWSNLHIKDKKA